MMGMIRMSFSVVGKRGSHETWIQRLTVQRRIRKEQVRIASGSVDGTLIVLVPGLLHAMLALFVAIIVVLPSAA